MWQHWGFTVGMLWSRFFGPISNHDHGKWDRLMIPIIKVLLIQEERLFGRFVFQILTLSFVIIVLFCHSYCGYVILWFNTVISATASKRQNAVGVTLAAARYVFQWSTGITWPTWSHTMGPVMLITWLDNRCTNQLAFLAAPVWRERSLS